MSASKQSMPCPFEESFLRLVMYRCTCGTSQPLSRLYFCRHCLAQRCPFCVSHEVDSHYCPNCLENMPSAEARLKRNRCANCFDCPACGHTLSTRASSVQVPSAEDPEKSVPKKVFYLACAYCRWTSRDIGLPDQSVASGGWPELENPQVARLSVLQEHYRSLAQREKLEKESKRYVGKKLSYATLSDKYGLTTAVARRRAGLPPLSSPMTMGSPQQVGQDGSHKSVEMVPDEAVDISDVEVLPDELFEQEVDLCNVTTLAQRLRQIDLQPEAVSKVFPRHKHLMIKRSQRCRKCEHNLSKPEYNPSSIKFKIQLAAYYHIPEVVIVQVGALHPGTKCSFVLKIGNPTQHPTKVEFLTMKSYEEEMEKKKNEVDEAKEKEEKKISLLRNSSLVTASDLHKVDANAECQVPVGCIYVPPRDDAAEFDEAGPDLKGVVDDKNVVAWRRSNKVGVMLSAEVGKEVNKGDEVTTTFGLKFVYTNTISALEQREIQTVDVIVPVTIVLGTIE